MRAPAELQNSKERDVTDYRGMIFCHRQQAARAKVHKHPEFVASFWRTWNLVAKGNHLGDSPF